MDEELDRAWRALSEEVLAGVNEWRAAHPKATFQELRAGHSRADESLEAQVLQEAALARTATMDSCASAGPSALPQLWNASAGTREARSPLARTRRPGDSFLEKLWNLPRRVESGFFPLMKLSPGAGA